MTEVRPNPGELSQPKTEILQAPKVETGKKSELGTSVARSLQDIRQHSGIEKAFSWLRDRGWKKPETPEPAPVVPPLTLPDMDTQRADRFYRGMQKQGIGTPVPRARDESDVRADYLTRKLVENGVVTEVNLNQQPRANNTEAGKQLGVDELLHPPADDPYRKLTELPNGITINHEMLSRIDHYAENVKNGEGSRQTVVDEVQRLMAAGAVRKDHVSTILNQYGMHDVIDEVMADPAVVAKVDEQYRSDRERTSHISPKAEPAPTTQKQLSYEEQARVRLDQLLHPLDPQKKITELPNGEVINHEMLNRIDYYAENAKSGNGSRETVVHEVQRLMAAGVVTKDQVAAILNERGMHDVLDAAMADPTVVAKVDELYRKDQSGKNAITTPFKEETSEVEDDASTPIERVHSKDSEGKNTPDWTESGSERSTLSEVQIAGYIGSIGRIADNAIAANAPDDLKLAVSGLPQDPELRRRVREVLKAKGIPVTKEVPKK